MTVEGCPQAGVDEMIRRGVFTLNDGYLVPNFEHRRIGISFVGASLDWVGKR